MTVLEAHPVVSPPLAPLAPVTTVIETGGDLTLPPETLRGLRLLGPESFLVFGAGRHSLHLVRAGADPGVLTGRERVSLHGSIQSFGIADLFSLLNMSRRSGLLLVITDAARKAIWFRRGEIVFAASSLAEDRLGQVLYRVGKLSKEALAEAERHLVPGKRFGAVLLERKLIDSSGLWWGIKYQVEEIIYSVFRVDQGSFLFFDGDHADNELAHFTIDTNNVLMEGYRRVDEWGLIASQVRDRRTVLKPAARKPKGKLEDRMERLLALIDGTTTAEDLVRATGWGEFNTCKCLYNLLKAGLVEAVEGEAGGRRGGGVAVDKVAGLSSLAEVVEPYERAFSLLRDVLAAKGVEVDLRRAFTAFLRSASDRTRAIFQGLDLGSGRRIALDALSENVDHLLLMESASSQGGTPPSPDRGVRLPRTALREWTAFQIALVHNLLPAVEAAELVSYVRAIERSGAVPELPAA